jgi:cytochrome c553
MRQFINKSLWSEFGRTLFAFIVPPLLAASVCNKAVTAHAEVVDKSESVDFQRDVAPILVANCLRCHGSDAPEGDLSLSNSADIRRAGFVVSGKPEQSHLLTVIQPDGDQPPVMPKEGKPLSAMQVDLLRRWVAAGADWPVGVILKAKSKADSTWWSLQPIASSTPPQTTSTSKNPIDHFVRAKLEEKGLAPSPLADRGPLIRRLYFDLLGLPPTPEAVATFVADPAPKAYERLVDDLLASSHLGERWTRHWLDIAHYADTHGFERDKRRDNAWRYRDYVIRSFNDDKPYDQFLREQIAGDAMPDPTTDSIIATGFLAAGPWDFVGQVETKSPKLNRAARALDLDDMLTQVMTSTVAMTANCARCHDHKLDPITQREYYQLAAVFAGVRRDNRDVSPQLRKEYEAERTRLTQAISQLSGQIGRLRGEGLDLADIVGGGNGFGTGRKGIGIDARTGKMQERPFGDLGNVKPGNYASSPYAFVDGVFVPANGETKISSSGLKASELPANSGKAWDMIRNGPVSSQFSTTLGNVDYNSAGHTMIGLHANAGITFDLAAIRAAGQSETSAETSQSTQLFGEPSAVSTGYHFSCVVGYGGRTVEPSAQFRVYLDGQLKAIGRLGRNDTQEISFDVPPIASFLTLISTDGGNGYGHDQISFGDPRLTLAKSSTTTDAKKNRITQLEEQESALKSEMRVLGEPPEFYGVVGQTPPAMHIHKRGDPESPGDAVQPGALGFGKSDSQFGSADMPESERRLALAQWITSPDNPLTRRVIVNRIWHWHFGSGIVDTPSDFGFGGGRPSHPLLLDWLADELLRSGWSLKHIHRLIVTSLTYQQQSVANFDSAAARTDSVDSRTNGDPTTVDVDNRLLWRMNPRRLEAEAVRDSVLAVTGKLNRAAFGPGYRDFDYKEEYAPVYTYLTADSPPLWRRSVYRFIVRTTPQQFMTALDCPDPANLTPKRNVTTTALQSLALYNNDFMLKQSRYFAERLKAEAGSDVPKQVERSFLLAFGREPDTNELQLSRQAIAEQGLWQFCRAMINANEFIYID